MPDASGTPTSPDNIPTYNTAVDPPSGKGFNTAMAQIQAIISELKAGTLPSGKINAAAALTGVVSTANLGTGTADGSKFLRGDGFWAPPDWQTISATLTYSSTDGHTFVVTTSGVDLTGVIPVGARIRLTNQAATQYFIVTAISSTTITLYGGSSYSITNTAITTPAFSQTKAPVGFPLDPTGWTEQLDDTTQRTQVNPVSGTWYNLGALSLAVPIGLWNLEYGVALRAANNAGTAPASAYAALSTNSAAASHSDLVGRLYVAPGTSYVSATGTITRRKFIPLVAKTTFYLIAKVDTTSIAELDFQGQEIDSLIRAVCAYL